MNVMFIEKIRFENKRLKKEQFDKMEYLEKQNENLRRMNTKLKKDKLYYENVWKDKV